MKQKLKEFNECDTRARKDKKKHEDGIIEFIKKGFICNKLKEYGGKNVKLFVLSSINILAKY